MVRFMFRGLLAASMALALPLALAACGAGSAETETETTTDAASTDPHAGHDHSAHADADAADAAAAGMAMEKVDSEGAEASFADKPAAGAKGICPVSKEAFVVKDTTVFSEHDGRHYGFCCPGCKPKFDADPASFTEKPAAADAGKPAEG